MKKSLPWIALILALLMLVPMFSGCQRDPDPPDNPDNPDNPDSPDTPTPPDDPDDPDDPDNPQNPTIEAVGFDKETNGDGSITFVDHCNDMTNHYAQKNVTGSAETITPEIDEGVVGDAFWFYDLSLRSGWFFRIGTCNTPFLWQTNQSATLTFQIYVDDVSVISGAGIELGSTDNADQEECEWNFVKQLKNDGWNTVTLTFDKGLGSLNQEKIVRWRLFLLSNEKEGSVTVAIDDIRLTYQDDTQNGGDNMMESLPEQVDTATVKDGTWIDPCNNTGAAYFFEGNTGSLFDVTPTLAQGRYGQCLSFPNLKTRSGWFFRLGTTSTFDLSLSSDSVVSFWIYVSDWRVITDARLELGNVAQADTKEKEWSFSSQLRKNGWNYVTLDFSSGSDSLDLSSVKRWRMFFISSTQKEVTLAVDDIMITNAATNTPQTADIPAQLVVDPYDSTRANVVTIDVTAQPYSADKTGKIDATKVINQALEDCSTLYHGGVVYLPSGNYLISGTITVPVGVTLLGDACPTEQSKKGSSGTTLLAKTRATVVNLKPSSCIDGVTIYYPMQSIDAVIPCDYSIVSGGTATTIRNVTLANSYRGFSVSAGHGITTIDGLRGTALYQALEIVNASEIDVVEHVDFSPNFWAQYDSAVDASKVRQWMNENSDCALYSWGCEGTTMSDAIFDGYRNGIYFDKTQRTDLAETYAQFYDVHIKDSDIAVYVKASYVDMGDQFAYSTLEGRKYAVYNLTTNVIKLSACTISGKIVGKVEHGTPADDFQRPNEEVTFSYPTVQKLFNVAAYGVHADGSTSDSEAIQKALDAAHSAGGGYVYLPSGLYLIDSPLTVYENTFLLGSTTATPKDTTGDVFGSILFITYGKDGGEDDTAAITLQGNRAGIGDIRIIYINNGARAIDDITFDDYSPAIACLASDNYVKNVFCYGTCRAVRIYRAKNTVIYRLCGGFYKNAVRIVDSEHVIMDALLSNAGGQRMTACRSFCPTWANDTQTLLKLSRTNERYITALNSTDVYILNTFAYQPKNYLISTNSTVYFYNAYSSRMGAANYMFILDGGVLHGVNTYIKDAYFFSLANNPQVRVYNNKGQILPANEVETDRTLN